MNRETIDVRDVLDAHKGCRLQWTVAALIFVYCLDDGFDATVIGFLAVLSSYRQKDEQGRSELAIDGLAPPCGRTRPFPRPRWPGRAPRVCAERVAVVQALHGRIQNLSCPAVCSAEPT